MMEWPLQREGRVAGWGLAEPVPSGSACGHRQEQFLTGLPTFLQPLRPPDHRLSGWRAASGSGPRLGLGGSEVETKPLGSQPLPFSPGILGVGRGVGGGPLCHQSPFSSPTAFPASTLGWVQVQVSCTFGSRRMCGWSHMGCGQGPQSLCDQRDTGSCIAQRTFPSPARPGHRHGLHSALMEEIKEVGDLETPWLTSGPWARRRAFQSQGACRSKEEELEAAGSL